MLPGIRKVLRGQIGFARAAREAFWRGRVGVIRRQERGRLDELASMPARLRTEYQNLSSSDLVKHFRERISPAFFPGFKPAGLSPELQGQRFPEETERLIESARQITQEHRWSLLGFGEQQFDNPINWRRDPLSGRIWPLDYHADIPMSYDDGSDIRVLWELNRLGHLITLGRAYALTREEKFAAEFFAQLESWHQQNPLGRGANWSCAMEVALRAMDLLAAFSLFRHSSSLSNDRLLLLLAMFDQHGAHIQRNLEFSHVATSNHYLSDIVGLLWLGIMLPELAAAGEWREWSLSEMLREMDKQVLPDGADYEGSTGYHCFVLELFLYTFILCRANHLPIADKYWRRLHAMLRYLRGITRPDGMTPLIGDTDGSQALPIVFRNANDRAYLLAIGATVFNDSQLIPASRETPPELLWLLGEEGLRTYAHLPSAEAEPSSRAFPDAGTYLLRHDDLFLLFNANGTRSGRPSSHRHNDAFSIEVAAGGRVFIVDPGTYVYTADLRQRHRFRSTSYHSTVEIDGVEQNTIQEDAPFLNRAEAVVKVSFWESTPERDRVTAKHSGYHRLAEPVKHQRTITFDKLQRWWLVEDELSGKGEHTVATRFHFDSALQVAAFDKRHVVARDERSKVAVFVCSLDLSEPPRLDAQFTSQHYGSRAESVSACWLTRVTTPTKLRWVIVPVRAGEDQNERLPLITTGH